MKIAKLIVKLQLKYFSNLFQSIFQQLIYAKILTIFDIMQIHKYKRKLF